MIIFKMMVFPNVLDLFLPLALSTLLISSSINGLERKDDQKEQLADTTNCQNCSICQYPCKNPSPPQPSLPEPLPMPLPPPPSYEYTPPPPCALNCCQYPPNSYTNSPPIPPNSYTNSPPMPPNSYTNSPPMPYTFVPSSSRLAYPFLLLLLPPLLLWSGTILQC